jgi:hypothetical protein
MDTGRCAILIVGPISGLFIGAELLDFTWSIHRIDLPRFGLRAALDLVEDLAKST